MSDIFLTSKATIKKSTPDQLPVVDQHFEVYFIRVLSYPTARLQLWYTQIMPRIKVALVGIGNCASALVQGIEYYTNGDKEPIGAVSILELAEIRLELAKLFRP